MDLMKNQADPSRRNTRDAGLHRIKKLTRWSLAGALTGTGVFAGLAAHAGGGTTGAATKTATANQSTATPSVSKSTTSTTSAAGSGSSDNTSAPTTTTVAPSSGSATILSGAS